MCRRFDSVLGHHVLREEFHIIIFSNACELSQNALRTQSERKNGGDLPFEKFKQWMINNADIEMTKKINKIMKDKMRGEGLAALLGFRA